MAANHYGASGCGSCGGAGYIIRSSRAATVAGDLNHDGTVNVLDLSILLSAWGTTNATADPGIGYLDFSSFGCTAGVACSLLSTTDDSHPNAPGQAGDVDRAVFGRSIN